MARKKDSVLIDSLEILCRVPWWVSPIVSAVIFVSLYFIYPAYVGESKMAGAFVHLSKTIAPFMAIVFLVPAPISFFNSKCKSKKLDRQTGIDSIRLLDWKRFEELLGEIFRRKGYRVFENHDAGPDGGVDLHLVKDGETVLVQCKQWRAQKVGVNVVRELYGVMAAECSPKGIVVTSGKFTKDAEAFAHGKALILIDGEKLEPLLKDVQNRAQPEAEQITKKVCPKCGKDMALRTAKKGPNIGNKFWGCSGFPNCRAVVNI